MIKEEKKDEIKKEFRKILLKSEKDNLSQLHQKSDVLMVETLKNEFEKVVKSNENN